MPGMKMVSNIKGQTFYGEQSVFLSAILCSGLSDLAIQRNVLWMVSLGLLPGCIHLGE